MSTPGTEHKVIAALVAKGQTVAVAESLTGGMVTARLIDVPGASAAVRGGVVAYHNAVKEHLLGLSREVLDAEGAVRESVALAMASAVRGALEANKGADFGVSTTGVAGPDPDPDTGAPAGLVYLAVVGPDSAQWVRKLESSGTREEIRALATDAAIDLLAEAMEIGSRE